MNFAKSTQPNLRATVREAQLLEKNGVDAIVAQGYEAGGHRGTDLKMTSIQDALIGTIALVPQVVDAVKIPVIASGGIMIIVALLQRLHWVHQACKWEVHF